MTTKTRHATGSDFTAGPHAGRVAAMLERLPPRLHRAVLRAAHAARLVWWRLRRPELHGCNAIVANAAGEILLVRHSYQSTQRWMLPGGGLARGETPAAAAVREVWEEVACRVVAPHCLGVDIVPLAGARNHVHLVAATTADTPVPDGREIVAAAFFAPDGLPDGIMPAARRRIALWLAEAAQNSDS